jgi:hypothetical protein
MGSAGFDATLWSHWLLIGCFVGLSGWSLYMSWQWDSAAKARQKQARLARRLAMELHGSHLYGNLGQELYGSDYLHSELPPKHSAAYQKAKR